MVCFFLARNAKILSKEFQFVAWRGFRFASVVHVSLVEFWKVVLS